MYVDRLLNRSHAPLALLECVAILFVVFQTPTTRLRLCKAIRELDTLSSSPKPEGTFGDISGPDERND
jgi:hypothetical protein